MKKKLWHQAIQKFSLNQLLMLRYKQVLNKMWSWKKLLAKGSKVSLNLKCLNPWQKATWRKLCWKKLLLRGSKKVLNSPLLVRGSK